MICGKDDIFSVESIDSLVHIYNLTKEDPANKRHHNVYSGAISAYIKYREGKSLRPKVEIKTSEM